MYRRMFEALLICPISKIIQPAWALWNFIFETKSTKECIVHNTCVTTASKSFAALWLVVDNGSPSLLQAWHHKQQSKYLQTLITANDKFKTKFKLYIYDKYIPRLNMLRLTYVFNSINVNKQNCRHILSKQQRHACNP